MTVRLPDFGYVEPSSLDEATALLSDPGRDVTIVGGGTDLIPKMKRGQTAPSTLVSLAGIRALRGIRIDHEGNCIIGASTTLTEIAASRDVPSAISDAALAIASPQIRNTATLGGNLCLDTRCNYIDMSESWRAASGFCLKDGGDTCWVAPKSDKCWAISSTDLAPVVIALEGSVRFTSTRGDRVVPAEELYNNDGMDHLNKQPDEILVEISIPPSARGASFQKLRRRGSIDFALLNVACAVELDAEGQCGSARIVVGGVASSPMRATDAEEYLVGKDLSPETVEEAANLASRPLRPQDNTDMGSRYRKWMIAVYVARALNEAVLDDA
jgi:4-hydroxybenzoyl-CoA reductase subunit beta